MELPAPASPGGDAEEVLIGSESASEKVPKSERKGEGKGAALLSRFPSLSPPGTDMVAEAVEPSAQVWTGPYPAGAFGLLPLGCPFGSPSVPLQFSFASPNNFVSGSFSALEIAHSTQEFTAETKKSCFLPPTKKETSSGM